MSEGTCIESVGKQFNTHNRTAQPGKESSINQREADIKEEFQTSTEEVDSDKGMFTSILPSVCID
jgi:hypothetical protein